MPPAATADRVGVVEEVGEPPVEDAVGEPFLLRLRTRRPGHRLLHLGDVAIELVVEVQRRAALADAGRDGQRPPGAVALDRHRELRLRAQRGQEVAHGPGVGARQRIAGDIDDGVAQAQSALVGLAVVVEGVDERALPDVAPRPAVADVLDALRRQEDGV